MSLLNEYNDAVNRGKVHVAVDIFEKAQNEGQDMSGFDINRRTWTGLTLVQRAVNGRYGELLPRLAALKADFTSTASLCMLKTRIRARGLRARMLRIASNPLAPGIEMSITTTSGSCALKAL